MSKDQGPHTKFMVRFKSTLTINKSQHSENCIHFLFSATTGNEDCLVLCQFYQGICPTLIQM